MKICLDAGHNDHGWDTGAQYYGFREQDLTFDITKKVKQELEQYVEIIETRPTRDVLLGKDLNSSLNTRALIANNANVDYFVSIHCNAFADSSAKGTETYIIGKGGEAEKLANKVQSELLNAIGTKNRGVQVKNLSVLRNTKCPAILIETAFLSNADDCNKLVYNQKEIAKAIAHGILSHLGIPDKSTNKYSYDDTVNGLIEHGITDIANMAHWEMCLDGRKPLNKDEVRTIFNRLLARLK